MYGQMTSMNPFGLEVEKTQSQMPTMGSFIEGLKQQPEVQPAQSVMAQPAMPEAQKPAAPVTVEDAKGKAELGKAGVMAATTLLGKLLEAKAAREKAMRERKSEAATTVAKGTQEVLQEQQASTANPLTQLIGAYRSAL
jgi:hypothetical protein